MMTFMKSVKEKITTWFSNNRMLGAILIGAIGVPLVVFIVAGVMATLLFVLSIFFGQFYGAIVLLMMIAGGIGGYVWSYKN